MQVICKCGCKINFNDEFKMTKDQGVPAIPITCPNCHKKILSVVIDMDMQSILVTNKKSKQIELSFKEADDE